MKPVFPPETIRIGSVPSLPKTEEMCVALAHTYTDQCRTQETGRLPVGLA